MQVLFFFAKIDFNRNWLKYIMSLLQSQNCDNFSHLHLEKVFSWFRGLKFKLRTILSNFKVDIFYLIVYLLGLVRRSLIGYEFYLFS